jgi:hypothetical protein
VSDKIANTLLDDLANLQFELKEAGLTNEGIARLTRFIRLDFDSATGKKELKRWKEVGLIKDGKIVITAEDRENMTTINFCLWDAVYNDELQFVPPDHYSISEWKKKEIEAQLEITSQRI